MNWKTILAAGAALFSGAKYLFVSAILAFSIPSLVAAEDAPALKDQWPMPPEGRTGSIAVDSTDTVYILDREKFRVYKYNAQGTLLGEWRAVCPTGIGVDSSGYIYVGDQCQNLVHKFSSTGIEVHSWFSPTPWSIFVDQNDYVYAGSYHEGTVDKYDTAGNHILTIGDSGSGPGQNCNIHDVTVDKLDNVYVTDNCDRVHKYDSQGSHLYEWSGAPGHTHRGVVVDSTGNVYVSIADDIQKFQNDGTFMVAWGGFRYPRGLALDSAENLYVVDEGNDLIKIYASPAERLACVGFEPPLANYPVTIKKSRALPLKAEVFDADGIAATSAELIARPVVQVWFDSGDGGDAVDVTDEVLSVGQGDEGNQFVFTEGDRWQFNLSTKNYTSPGTYSVLMQSGDDSEYVIEPTCMTEFVIK